jgi:hypothetical protein
MYKRNLSSASKGPTLPLASIETNLVVALLEMESNREPLYFGKGLELANSLIKDTIHKDEFIKCNIKHLGKYHTVREGEGIGRLGHNYWRGFLSRHPMLREKKHAKFDQKKDGFVKPEIFQGMYTQIYPQQVRTGKIV